MFSKELMIQAQTMLYQPEKSQKSFYNDELRAMLKDHEELLVLSKGGHSEKYYLEEPNLDKELRQYLELHKQFIESPGEKKLSQISEQLQVLFPILDREVKLHEENHVKQINQLESYNITIWVGFVLAALLEGLFIFLPAAKEVEEKTRQIETERIKYKALMGNSSDGIFIMGFDGKLWEFSLHAARMLGYSEEEMYQLTVTDWDVGIPPEQLPSLIQSVGEKPIIFETRHKRKDGSIYDASITTVKITILGKSYLYASVRDITEDNALRVNLFDTKEMLDEAQKIAQLGSWSLNLKTDVLTWSEEIFHIFEVDSENFEPSYEGFLKAIHPDDMEIVNQAFSDSVESKTAYAITHRLRMKDGRIKYVREKGHTEYNEEGEPIRSSGTVQDITNLYRGQIEREQYLALIDENIITSSTDLKGRINYTSEAFAKISGYSKEELIGKNHNIVRHPDMSPDIYKDLWNTISQDRTWMGEIKNLKKDGTHYWVNAIISPKYDDENNKVGYTAIRQDITDKKKIEELAITDRLTQIFNRVHLDFIIQKCIHESHRYGNDLAVILIDVDHFKSVNDTYGHQVGDLVLKETAAILSKNVRKADTLGRWGGEEFLIVAPETNLTGGTALAEKLRTEIQKFPFTTIGSKTASFGVSSYRQDDTEETLLKRADDALYLAKKNGRNRVETELLFIDM